MTIPNFDMNTQGKDLAEAIFMARDAIRLIGIGMEDAEATKAEKAGINFSRVLQEALVKRLNVGK